MLDEKDLSAIASLLDKKLEPIRKDISELKTDVSVLKTEMAEVKEDVSVLKTEMVEVKNNICRLEDRMTKVEDRMTNVEDRMTTLEGRMTNVENDVSAVRCIIENETNKNIQLLAEAHLSSNKHSMDAENISSAVKYSQEMQNIRLNILEGSVERLKKAVGIF